MGWPRPNHSSMASMSGRVWRRAISTVTELSSRMAVVSQRMGGTAAGSQALMAVVVGVEPAGGLGDGEDADQRGEEEEDGSESEEEAEAAGDKALTGMVRAVGTVVPVVVVAPPPVRLRSWPLADGGCCLHRPLRSGGGGVSRFGGVMVVGIRITPHARAMSRDYSDWAAGTTGEEWRDLIALDSLGRLDGAYL